MTYTFGNWFVKENGVEYSLNSNFFIERNALILKRNETTYDWMLHTSEKTGVFGIKDIFWFNTAFLFATTYFNLELDLDIFYTSILEQKKILNEDFDNNEGEITIGNN